MTLTLLLESKRQSRCGLALIDEINVLHPPPAEQTRTVAAMERLLSVVKELEVVGITNFQRAQRLWQSILKNTFAGELLQRDHKP